jgi:hypothetical protein
LHIHLFNQERRIGHQIFGLLGLIESPAMTHEESVLIAEIKEEIRKQIGVFYPQD